MAASNNVFSVFSFIAFVLVCIPFPWHLQAWNTGTCLYMAWTAVGCLVLFINSIVWNDNIINRVPVWCDITTKIMIGISVAIPAASLCINRRLYHIASVRSAVMKTVTEKRRAVICDLAIGMGIPVAVMALHYIVQGHRFDIFEDAGCFPTTYSTPPAYVIVWAPPIAIGLVSAVYSALSIRVFHQSRTELKSILSMHSGLTQGRYFRLMALAGIEILFCVPLGITTIVLVASKGVHPWISWEDTHFNFSVVRQIPASIWRSTESGRVSVEMTRWLVVLCAFTFFIFFGFGDEAGKHYRLAINSIGRYMGYTIESGKSKISSSFGNFGPFNSRSNDLNLSGAGLPVYVSREVLEKRDSIDSQVSGTTIKDSIHVNGVDSPFSTLVKPMLVVDVAAGEKTLKTTSDGAGAGVYSGMAVERLSPGCFPTSVSPSPSGSFLDLSVTCVNESPLAEERRHNGTERV